MVSRIGNQNVRYEAFDFHAECRHMRWDRLNVLMDRLSHDQEQMGYFLLSKDGALLSVQDGVFRTNCIDCLDRTNVVQSMLAKRVLNEALSRLGILRNLDEHPSLEHLFKQVCLEFPNFMNLLPLGGNKNCKAKLEKRRFEKNACKFFTIFQPVESFFKWFEFRDQNWDQTSKFLIEKV